MPQAWNKKGSALYITDKEFVFGIFKENIQRTPTVCKKKKQPNRKGN